MLRITKEFVIPYLLCFAAATGLFMWPFELGKLEQSTRATRKKKDWTKGNKSRKRDKNESKMEERKQYIILLFC